MAMAIPKALRMGILPASFAIVTGVLTQVGHDLPRFAPYATILVAGLALIGSLMHPGLGGDNPWFNQDQTGK